MILGNQIASNPFGAKFSKNKCHSIAVNSLHDAMMLNWP